MKFFNLSQSDLPKPKRASFILDVEIGELFIQAGLQDRVIQVYEGLVDMDFDKDLMNSQGLLVRKISELVTFRFSLNNDFLSEK